MNMYVRYNADWENVFRGPDSALKVVDLIAFLDVKSPYSVGEGVPCS